MNSPTLTMSYEEMFVRGQARRVRAEVPSSGRRRTALIISEEEKEEKGVPHSVKVRAATRAGLLNFAGATSIQTEAERRALYDFIVRVGGGDPDLPFEWEDVCLSSGGTRVLEEGIDQGDPTGTMTIVEAPGVIYLLNRDRQDGHARKLITMGHAPRTAETLGYEGDESSFSISDDADTKTIANPDIHFLWIVQEDATKVSEWDGDLEAYLNLLAQIKAALELDGHTSGQLFYSGGGVTAKEIWGTLKRDIPGILVRGSGRVVDSFIAARDGQWSKVTEQHERLERMLADDEVIPNVDQLTVVDVNNPRAAQLWLQEYGFGRIL